VDAGDRLDVRGQLGDALLGAGNARQVVFAAQWLRAMLLGRRLTVCLLDRHVGVRNVLVSVGGAGRDGAGSGVLRGLRVGRVVVLERRCIRLLVILQIVSVAVRPVAFARWHRLLLRRRKGSTHSRHLHMGSTARSQPRLGCRGFHRTDCNFATWRVFGDRARVCVSDGRGAQADAEAAERCADRAQSWMTVCCFGLGM
jgi:hypothetical protein